ncbi:PREDICTED: transmembrane 7 superfamily member 3-like [Acropora digitifera]|uniref:transmembrane 7 superfamily member 3-like n=1 Tax=Acropora digitifera TaxID=70779 RepID=UPI00077B1BE4|nr:PREDICTED: transmembrane 7 superfamily member 3-like [Acropora digitifera]
MLREAKVVVVIFLQTLCVIEQNVAEKFKVGPNRGEKMTLQPSVNLALNFDKAQKKWRFAIFQAHAQSNNVTLSLNARYEYGLTVTGSDIALLFPLPIADISYPFYLRSDNNHSSYCADIIAVPYEDGAPFPGACCLTCSTEFDPNIAISSNYLETNMTFAFANVYYGRSFIVDAVFAVIGSIAGLILCFSGFRFFKITLFVGGLVNFSVLLFIVISANSDMSHIGLMLTSVGVGVVFAVLVFALWWFTEWTRLCLFLNSLFLGFLVGATLMFTPFGALDAFHSSEFNYGAVMCACTVVVPAAFILWPRVLGIDFFLHTSLSYIVIDVILHASKPQFRRDHIVVVRPFQKNDIILSSTWVVLAIMGVIFQSVHARSKKKQFPKSGFVEQKRIRKYLMSKNKVDEKTPILINSDNNDTYGANNIC